MNELINGNAIKMTSIEIAELVGKRHDNVKRTIETLAKNGVIRLPQIEDCGRINGLGLNQSFCVYVFEGEQGKRDSIVVVASVPLGSGTDIGTLASTGGTVRTAILYGTTANRTTATVIELFRDGTVAAGHTFTLRDISFGDSRALGADFGGSFGNLYKF